MDTEHREDLAEEGLQQFRIERGAQVLGTDGLLGTVHQVVMDQMSGRLQSLVVRGEAGMDYELPAAYIETSTGDEVRLNIGRADLINHPNLAHPYEPEMYAPVESGQVMPPSAAADQAQDNPMLTNIEENAVDVVAPASDTMSDITPDMTSGISAAAPLGGDLETTAAMGDELDEVDEVDEIEAVIIPGDQPGETDVFIASTSDAPATGAMMPAEAGPWTPTRGPQGADYRGPGGRSLVGVLAATGVLLVTGGAITTYLLVRRRQERDSLGARVRQQAGNAATNAAALRDAVRARSQARWSDLNARARDQQRQVRDRMNVWMPAAASSLAALRDQAVERGNALSDSIRQQAQQAAKTTNRAVAPSGSARRTASRLGNQLSDRASDLRDQITAMVNQAQKQVRPAATWRRMKWPAQAGAFAQRLRAMPDQAANMWGRLARRTTQATRTAATTNTQAVKSAQKQAQKTVQRATASAGKQAKQARANAQRGVRRMRRRARWFRNGIVAGVIGGVLYAPRAGRDTRTTLISWLSRIPGLDTFFAPATPGARSTQSTMATGMTAGAAGPHPQSALPGARESWRGMDTTPSTLGTTSEQSGGLPLAPDLTPEDMPGPAI